MWGGDMAKKEKKKDSKPNDLALPYFSFPDGDVCVHVLMHACGSFLCVNSTKGQEFVESHDRQDLEGTQHIGGKASTRFE